MHDLLPAELWQWPGNGGVALSSVLEDGCGLNTHAKIRLLCVADLQLI